MKAASIAKKLGHGQDGMKKSRNLTEKKSLLIENLRSVRQNVLTLACRADQETAEEVFLGSWSILDILAHLEGWDYTNIEASKQILRGEVPDFYSQYNKDWSYFNSQLVSKFKVSSLSKMVDNVRKSHNTFVDYLSTLTPEEIFHDQGVRRERYKVIISRLLDAEIKDNIEHSEQIEKYLELRNMRS